MRRRVFALTGKPGCGKSFVAKQFTDWDGYPVVGMGEEMRRLYKELPRGDDRHQTPTGTWEMAQALRDSHGEAGPAVATTGSLAAAFVESDRVVLDGVRNTKEVDHVRRTFDTKVHLIAVECDYDKRFERFYERGGYDEEYDEDVAIAVAEKEMNTRTRRESEEGLQEAIDSANYKIDNSVDDESHVKRQVARLLDDFDGL